MIRLLVTLSVIFFTVYADACPNIVSRKEWKAMKPKNTNRLSTPVSYVFIHHTTGPSCNSKSSCSERVRNIQHGHMKVDHTWDDIAYSFLIGQDGTVLEGRGWSWRGIHTEGYNSNSIGISFIGTFNNNNPSSAALKAAEDLIACGVANGYIKSNYDLKGHRDVKRTECPGNSLYNLIKTWSHYKA